MTIYMKFRTRLLPGTVLDAMAASNKKAADSAVGARISLTLPSGKVSSRGTGVGDVTPPMSAGTE
jgi:hypothetical protein